MNKKMQELGRICSERKARASRLNGCKPKKPNPIKPRAIAYRQAGNTLQATADLFGVSVATICRWCR